MSEVFYRYVAEKVGDDGEFKVTLQEWGVIEKSYDTARLSRNGIEQTLNLSSLRMYAWPTKEEAKAHFGRRLTVLIRTKSEEVRFYESVVKWMEANNE